MLPKHVLFLTLTFLLNACGPSFLVPPTPTATEAIRVVPTYTPTLIPPTPTEAAPVLVLDKRMTTMQDIIDDISHPYKLEIIPTVTTEDVSKRLLANTLDAYWGQDGTTYDANGNVILPPGVLPVKPDQWQISISHDYKFQGLIYADWEDAKMDYSTYNSQTSPVQRSWEHFKVADGSGNITKILIVSKLYYYDSDNKLHVTPVFNVFDLDHVDVSGNTQDSFGDINHITASIGPGVAIPKFNLGREESSTDYDIIEDFVDYEKFLSEPMQAKRDQMIQTIKDKNFNPVDFGEIWVVPYPLAAQ